MPIIGLFAGACSAAPPGVIPPLLLHQLAAVILSGVMLKDGSPSPVEPAPLCDGAAATGAPPRATCSGHL